MVDKRKNIYYIYIYIICYTHYINIYINIYIYIYIYIYICIIYISDWIWCFVFCYLPKLKRDRTVVYSAGFLYTFSMKTFLTKYTLSIDQVSISDLFFLLRQKTKCILKFLFSQLMMSQTWGFDINIEL